MNYWLMKSEPSAFSIDDLVRAKREPWSGVRNFQARNFIKEMRKGDQALFYHSSADRIGVAGAMSIGSDPYPDPTQFDPKSQYYDPKSRKEKPIWYLVDVCFEKKFNELIPLQEIKAHKKLQGILVTQKGSRLSIQPVSKEHFKYICALLS